jgi:CHAT domain-containing protein
MRARIAVLLMAAACALQAGVAHAQAEDREAVDEFEADFAARRLSPEEKLRLQAIVEARPEADLSKGELLEFYERQYKTSLALRDYRSTERVLRNWIGSDLSDDDKADARWRLVNHLIAAGSRTEALALGESVLPGLSRIPKKIFYRATLSRAYNDQFDFKRSKELQDEAIAILNRADKNKNAPGYLFALKRAEATIYQAKSALLHHQGKFEPAVDFARRALELSRDALAMSASLGNEEKRKAKLSQLISIRYLLSSLNLSGRLYEAETVAYELLRKSAEYQEPAYARTRNYFLMADLRIWQGRYAEGLKFAEKAIAVGKQGGLPEDSTAMIFAKGRKINALTGLERWQDVRQMSASLESDIGDAANEKLTAAFSIPRALALLYGGETERAAAQLKTIYESRVKSYGSNHLYAAQAAGLYAVALRKQGKTEQARGLFAEAAANLRNPDGVGDGFDTNGLNKLYRRLILESYLDLLTSGAPGASVNDAYVLADYLRSSVVQQSVVDSALRSAASVAGLNDLVRKEQDDKNEISMLYGFLAKQLSEPAAKQLPKVIEDMRHRIAQLEAENKSLHGQIAQGFPEYDKLVNPQPPGVAETAQRLANGEVMLSILPTGTRTYVWLVRSDGKVAFHASTLTEAQIGQLVKRLRASLDIGDLPVQARPAFDAAAAYQLYQALLAPLSDAMHDARHLIVGTAGSLGQIPFAVLLTAPPGKGRLRDQPWLIKQVAISHVPSVSAWMALLKQGAHASAAQRRPFVGFGDPLFALGGAAEQKDGAAVRKVALTRAVSADVEQALVPTLTYARLPALPETRDEITAIAKAMKADPQKDAFFGRDASRSAVLKMPLADRQVIVFATHGLVAGDLPNLTQPALALAATGDDKESPLLTLEDVLNLKLDADWVVLSACNTAAADGQAGEAISGLGRGFFYAGSRALLVTHWAVESQSAKELTTATFRRFGSDPTLPRAEALRQAQLEVMKNEAYDHPFYWAPYALVGDGGR